ncbi:hypothetical protein POSPLADRAFT_1068917 [Postia placenta MAD-698-R-SB12]|uniref:Transmembrane protein n=1 Tax=Postia placenta MAD-698-R-SB12 TaxID=670580 RepID=A0A1X6NCP3_9APHY|nr:hypothetical protein POSPLADRAFT_1068917 [Postia placenta MAD-698-R-SB12]OSX66153.1 hypothetical protein POSPLADRAFT_1068917 [Postia placenta MAD-698-R-SB12]
MAAFNVSLDDSSPLISYSPPNVWLDTPANDTLTKFYSAGSLHTTAVDGAAAHFSFNGTGVWLYGGLRPDYGFYTFLVDGVQVLQGDARAADPELGHILAGISGLPMGEHTVQLKNAGNGPIDLDTMVFETTVGASGDSMISSTIDDMNSTFTYGPNISDWALDSYSSFFNNSLHYSRTQGAQASLSFSGDAIAVFGTVSPQHANYTITVDGHTSQEFDASSSVQDFHSQTLLFFAQNLGTKEHSLVITGNPGKDTGNDSTVPGPTTSGQSSGTSSTSDPSSTLSISATSTGGSSAATDSASRLSTGAIAGIVIGSLLGLLALLLLLFFLLRCRRGRPQTLAISRPIMPTDLTPDLPIQYDPDLEAAYGYERTPNSTERQIHMRQAEAQVYAELDAMGKRVTTATHVTRWSRGSYDSSSTLEVHEPYMPKWKTAGLVAPPDWAPPRPPPPQRDTDSTHTRNPSDTSTVVNEEVRQGVSEVVLRPTRVSDAPKTAPVRPGRPTLGFSVMQYYFEPRPLV